MESSVLAAAHKRGAEPRSGLGRTRRSTRGILAILAFIILALKCYLIFRPGMEDMVSYEAWGTEVGRHGLAQGYIGTYFPIQFQIFGWIWRVAEETGLEFSTLCKAVNLLFDLGSFVLVILLLQRYDRSLWYALLYWAHPWFVTVFSLGYVDFQFAFFLLLALYLATVIDEAAHPHRYYWSVGGSIAVAFLMKPQTQVIIIALAVYTFVRAWRMRSGRPLFTLLPSVLLFAVYTLYFFLAGTPFFHLSHSYLNVGKIMPCLTAHMLNFWYPLAYALKDAAAPIYSVSDEIPLTPLQIRPRTVAIVGTLALVVLFAGRQALRQTADLLGDLPKRVDFGHDLGSILAFVTMVVPFTMTSVHENHLFLGAIFLLLYVARTQNRKLMMVWQAIFFLQFLNIYILYETGGLAAFLLAHYPEGLRAILSVVDSLLFFYLLYVMLSHQRPTESSLSLVARWRPATRPERG